MSETRSARGLVSPLMSSLAAASVAVLAVSACADAPAPDEAVDSGPLTVTVEAVRLGTLRELATAPGTVVPSAAGDWTIYAPETGEVAEIPHAVGDSVEAGDVLVRFNLPSRIEALSSLQLVAREAEAALDEATEELARQSDLFERGVISRNAYEAARNRQVTAQSLFNAQQSRLEAIEAGPDTSVVTARFPGTITEVWHAPGDVVVGGVQDRVLRIVDPSRTQIVAELPVTERARLTVGQPATVRALTTALEEAASIVQIPPLATPGVATAEVRLALRNAESLPIDTPVTVEILLDVRADVPNVPAAAVQRDGTASYVMTTGADGLAHRRDVRVGLSTGDRTQVLSGLEVGDLVIVTGLTDDSEGLPVEIAGFQ